MNHPEVLVIYKKLIIRYLPTPRDDLLWEEDFFRIQNSYNSKTIYEWNLDGYSEYQICELICWSVFYEKLLKV